jgi:Ca2+-dependent lipid-binding protein
MAHNGADNADTVSKGDHLDELLRGFQSRNEFRSDPNYVLEPVDFTTSIPDRFVKILRTSSLGAAEEIEETVEVSPATEPETNSGLILLAENYDKNSKKKIFRGKVFSAIATALLFIACISFSAVAGYIWAGLVVSVVAAIFIIVSRTSTTQGEEIHQIAEALTQPDEAA